jgi:hypothetical protein
LKHLLVVLLDVTQRQGDEAHPALARRLPGDGAALGGVEAELVDDDVLLVVARRGEDAVEVVADEVLVALLGGELLAELAQRLLPGRAFFVLLEVDLAELQQLLQPDLGLRLRRRHLAAAAARPHEQREEQAAHRGADRERRMAGHAVLLRARPRRGHAPAPGSDARRVTGLAGRRTASGARGERSFKVGVPG